MIPPPPRSTRSAPLFPYTSLFRSVGEQRRHTRLMTQILELARHTDLAPSPADAALHKRLDRPGRACQPLKCGFTCRHREYKAMRTGQDIRRPSSLMAAPYRSEEHTSELQSLMRI